MFATGLMSPLRQLHFDESDKVLLSQVHSHVPESHAHQPLVCWLTTPAPPCPPFPTAQINHSLQLDADELGYVLPKDIEGPCSQSLQDMLELTRKQDSTVASILGDASVWVSRNFYVEGGYILRK